MRRNGIVRTSRNQRSTGLPTFRLIESGIFVVLANRFVRVKWWWLSALRRSTVREAR